MGGMRRARASGLDYALSIGYPAAMIQTASTFARSYYATFP